MTSHRPPRPSCPLCAKVVLPPCMQGASVVPAVLAFLAVLAVSTALSAILPLTALAGSITYLPQTSEKDILATPQAALLTWQLPGGMLVVDRQPGPGNRFGPASEVASALTFAPAFTESEWYLVRPKGHRNDTWDLAGLLARYGRIHLQDGGAFLVEVPVDRLDEFAALAVVRQRLPLDPLGHDLALAAGNFGAALKSAKVDSTLKAAFVASISDTSFYNRLQEISGEIPFWYDGSSHTVMTRYFTTAGNRLVADYLAAKLAGYGYTVELDTFIVAARTCRNVVATKLGTTAPDEIVVMGGHYDSMSEQPQVQAPGAEDNGSGTSAVVEVARLCANRAFERTVKFVLFDAEEEGLHGSEHFVDEAVANGDNIIGAIICDMVAWYETHYAVIIEGQTSWEWLMATMEANVADFTGLESRKDYYSWGSDHVPFQMAGIPAFLAIDRDWDVYPFYHTSNDQWFAIQNTAHIGVEIATACAVTVADVAILEPGLVSVAETTPSAPVMLHGYPNPFNPQVNITYRLPAASPAELAVYDLRGQKIAVLAAGWLEAGSYVTNWNGTDRSGRSLSSGVYVCRLWTPRTIETLKLNLVR